jgi:acyl carrier protein
MTDRHLDPALDLAARALAVVLDLEADDLRADSPLADLGADSVARVQWADLVEELAAAEAHPVSVSDAALRDAETLGDLAAHLVARTADAGVAP